MRELVRFTPDEAAPGVDEVLRDQGLPRPELLAPKVRSTLVRAVDLCRGLSEPRALLREIGSGEFAGVHAAAGPMPDGSVVARIYPRAEALALYAGTLGEPVVLEIRRLFAAGDAALGFLLDAAASIAADRLSYLAAARFREAVGGCISAQASVLPYGTGYCGWPTRGQRPLFEALDPREIGITLNDSCLMWPLKSVSGLLVAGPPEIHAFDADFAFCGTCATQACRERLGTLARG